MASRFNCISRKTKFPTVATVKMGIWWYNSSYVNIGEVKTKDIGNG